MADNVENVTDSNPFREGEWTRFDDSSKCMAFSSTWRLKEKVYLSA